MDYEAAAVERALRAGEWQPVPAVATLLGKARNTVWRWTQGDSPRFRSRPALHARQGRDLEVHPRDVLAYLDEWRRLRAAAEQPPSK